VFILYDKVEQNKTGWGGGWTGWIYILCWVDMTVF